VVKGELLYFNGIGTWYLLEFFSFLLEFKRNLALSDVACLGLFITRPTPAFPAPAAHAADADARPALIVSGGDDGVPASLVIVQSF
jgi:hypothetical protein